MRFTYLELENYIGIYNGMGLERIVIDMSKCRNRTLIIRGENGSGKSTIFKAMQVFPDGNESFIPGKPAKKIICLLDRDILYTIKFFHGIKSNGDRDTTKAFISKRVNGMDIELNENGNVTSFKDTLYNELSLDPNFAALSQLSLDDKGLADKRPAERKKFVNSIIESLEVYNDIYKAITKQSSNIKAMMDSIVAKLGSIGDINSLDRALNDIEEEINNLNQKKDLATQELMKYHATIGILDPDNSIQNKHSALSLDVTSSHRELKALMKKANMNLPAGPKYTLEYYVASATEAQKVIASLNETKAELERNINRLTIQITELDKELNGKKLRLNSLTDADGYQIAMDRYASYKAEVEEYLSELSITGIDPNAFTKDEYILALETLKDIKISVDAFRAAFDYKVIEEAVNTYRGLNWPSIAPLKDTTQYQNSIDKYESNRPIYTEVIHEAEMDMEALKNLDNRPKACIDDSCYFISNLIQIRNSNPEKRYKEYTELLRDLEEEYRVASSKKEEADNFNQCINQIRLIIREIDKNGAILSRLPKGGIFSSKSEFFEHLLTGDDFSYMEKIYQYIDFANILDRYHVSYTLMVEYKNKCDLYASKSELVENLESEISKIKENQSKCIDELTECREKLNLTIMQIDSQTEIYNDISNRIIPLLQSMCTLIDKIEKDNAEMQSIQQSIQKINECNGHMQYVADHIRALTSQLAPKMQQRDEIKFKIQQAEQYAKELNQLKDQYDRVEIIRHYSSPTKGIQLVFMELYMGKILNLANELLSLLFNGQYVIQPFIINETEFRIPCLGDGYINDDISSMSSSQLTMISMIISFSLLHASSTKYNIIKMDEIDAPLDENNRIMFIDVMNRIMDIMNVEQCVMISHNSELQVDNSDVILLKSSQLSTDYTRGNIIWKY